MDLEIQSVRKDLPLLRIICVVCSTPLNVVAGTFFQCPMCGKPGIAPQVGISATTPQVGADLPSDL